jgi:hypothetical protein
MSMRMLLNFGQLTHKGSDLYSRVWVAEDIFSHKEHRVTRDNSGWL